MKKKVLFLTLLSCFLFTTSTLAVDQGFLQISDTPLVEEFVAMKPEIPDFIGGSLTEGDIDLAALFPYYVNDNFFSPKIKSAADFLDVIAAQEYYLWMLPLKTEWENVVVAIDRTRPVRKDARRVLTAEQMAEWEAQVGKWGCSWASFSGDTRLEIDWKTIALSYQPDADQIILVNGLATIDLVMAVCIKDNVLSEVIAVTDAVFSIRPRDVATINEVLPLSTANGWIYINAGDRFSYEDLQNTLGRLSLTKPLRFIPGGGGSIFQLGNPIPWNFYFLTFSGLTLFLAGVFYIRKRFAC